MMSTRSLRDILFNQKKKFLNEGTNYTTLKCCCQCQHNFKNGFKENCMRGKLFLSLATHSLRIFWNSILKVLNERVVLDFFVSYICHQRKLKGIKIHIVDSINLQSSRFWTMPGRDLIL